MPTTAHNTVHVAVGVLVQNEHILIAQRPKDKHQGGLWEFPGGKVEAGESVPAALARELAEEVNLRLSCSEFSPLMQVPFSYPDKSVLLDVYLAKLSPSAMQKAKGLEGQEVRWVHYKSLADFTFPAANKPIVEAVLRLMANTDTPHF